MSDRTIQLRADLADQLLALADGMKKADIAWHEMLNASETGRKAYEDAAYDQWLTTQSTDDE